MFIIKTRVCIDYVSVGHMVLMCAVMLITTNGTVCIICLWKTTSDGCFDFWREQQRLLGCIGMLVGLEFRSRHMVAC